MKTVWYLAIASQCNVLYIDMFLKMLYCDMNFIIMMDHSTLIRSTKLCSDDRVIDFGFQETSFIIVMFNDVDSF